MIKLSPTRIALALMLLSGGVNAQAPLTPPEQGEPITSPMVTRVTPLVPPSERNAAIAYMVAMQALSSDFAAKVGAIDFDACGSTREELEKNEPFKAAAAEIAAFNPQVWEKASRLKRCDFEWAREEGFALLLPHLGKWRQAARSLRFCARYELGLGDPLRASEHLATMVRMSNHASGDGFLISSLVGAAIHSLALSEMQVLAQSGRLSDESKQVLLESLATVNREDPFLMRACIAIEEQSMIDSIKGKYEGPDAGRAFAKEIIGMSGTDDTATQLRTKLIDDWNGPRLLQEAEKARDAYAAITIAWDAPDPLAALLDVEQRITNEEFGVVAALLCPSMSKARASSLKVVRDLDETIAVIKAGKPAEATEAAPTSTP